MDDNETIADVLAAMRDEGRTGESSCLEWVGTKMRHYADRIESAHKRERDVMFDALVRIGNWCAQDLAENAYVSDSSGNYLKTLNGLCEVCRPFMRKANKLKKYGGANG